MFRSRDIYLVEHAGSMPYGAEDDMAIVAPVVGVDVGLHTLGEEAALACQEVLDHEAILVALISIALH